MKALDVDALQSILDTDKKWRRIEMMSLVTAMKGSNASLQAVIIRAGTPLLYAHWEGFGKSCFSRYLEFVSYRKLPFDQLTPSFLYLSSLGTLSQMGGTASMHELTLFTELLTRAKKKNKSDYRTKITTKSNLRYEVLKELLIVSGLDGALFETNSDFINKELCDARNEIAHGSGGSAPAHQFIKRRDETFALMDKLQTAVVNAALNQAYRAMPL